jgi:glutaredoxin-like protein NrdH
MVQLLTKPNCQPCRAMKRKLLEQNVSFNELSVTVNENMVLAKELGFLQVPVIILEDGSAFGGYRPDVVEAVALAQGVAA